MKTLTRLIIHGPPDHIFSKTLLEKSQNANSEIEVEIYESWEDLKSKLPHLAEATLLLINANEKTGVQILNHQPKSRVLICRGGEKEFQPTLTLVRTDNNHQYFLFESWDDFVSKIIDTPIRLNPLVSATTDQNLFRMNLHNRPNLAERQKIMISQKFFWFSVYFSKHYLRWFREWTETVMYMRWQADINLSEKGKIKRLIIPFANIFKGELIFREGEKIIFQIYGNGVQPGKCSGTIISSDEESLEIILEKALPRKVINQFRVITKGANILSQTMGSYRNSCSGYSDLSQADFIYQQEDHFNRPEDFLRGYLPNHNPLHLPIPHLKLDGPSRAILYDESQTQALLDMLGPSYLSLIEGGPGTGKTTLTAVAIKQLILSKRIVLLSSHSNKGLDNLLESLMEHVDEKLIFRLGNNPDLISSEKVKRLHRHYRFEKQVKAAEKAWRKKWEDQNIKEEYWPKFRADEYALLFENDLLWQMICSGKSFVLATTINSAVFDKQLGALIHQTENIWKANIEKLAIKKTETNPLFDLPPAAVKHMLADPKAYRPSFSIDVTIIDEATKARFYEIVPLLKRTNYKLILIGDTDQLGNISISPEASEEIMEMVREECDYYGTGLSAPTKQNFSHSQFTIYPKRKTKDDHSLVPIKSCGEEVLSWYQCFADGVFFSLLQNGNLVSEKLNVNRRSLESITKFLNQVFKKNMKIGRFNPRSQGSVTFLDVKGDEERIKTSYKNRQEKNLVVDEVIKFFKKQQSQKGAINLKSLGVIAMYRGQIGAIKESLRKELLFNPAFNGLVVPENIDQTLKEMVNTVDAFQGSERETIILSLVRANTDGRIGFNTDIRRIYVALSRAKGDLIIIGDSSTFLQSPELKIKKVFGGILNYTQTKKNYSRKTKIK